MTLRLVQDIRFGRDSGDTQSLGAGWSADEPGYRWAVGQASELWLRNPGGDLLLELEGSPHAAPGVPKQRVFVHADDAFVGQAELTGVRRWGVRIPATASAGREDMRLTLLHPDAARPSDYGNPTDGRPLAVSYTRLRLSSVPAGAARSIAGEGGWAPDTATARTGLAPDALVTRFESLGDNCEFGLVQRRCGAEPLSLLRFSNIPLLHLLMAIDSGFDGLGEPAHLEWWLDEGERREFVIRDRAHALVFHTFKYEGEAEGATLLAQQATRLRFLKRKLLEDMVSGDKIFVIRRQAPLAEADVLPLCAALSRHGPCIVLWAALADSENPPGTVTQVFPGLLRAHFERLAPDENAHDMAFETWLEVCGNALALTSRR